MIAIVGGRDAPVSAIKAWLDRHKHLIPVSGIVTGCARGADQAAREWAKENDIPLLVFTADWEKQGKAAGHIHNAQVIGACTSVLCFWDGKSPGSLDAIRQAVQAGKSVRIGPMVQLV